MKITHLLALLVAPLAMAASDYQNALSCANRNPSINAAISKLCNRLDKQGNLFNNIVVPSPYTSKGATVDGVRVRIEGSCKPAQWVPMVYCGAQFHEMCAGGQSRRNYGRNGCQMWVVEQVDGGKVAGAVGEAAEGKLREGVEGILGAVRGGG